MKKLRINIIPENGKVINITFSYRILKFLIVLSIVVIIGIFYLASIYGKVYILAIKALILENENKSLKEEIVKIQEIKLRLKNIEKIYKKFYAALEVDKSSKFNPFGEEFASDSMEKIIIEKENINSFIPDIFPVEGWISRRYDEKHKGIDISAKEGTPIISPVDGIVKESKYDEYFGNMIRITNEMGFEIVLCHNKENLVKAGDSITKGKVIGYVGNTGKSTSSHLHYEILFQGKNVDPLTYLPKGGR